ncbi:MAG: [protein-PII] uridylyltransferase [Acidimicrobiales bacterium]
MTVLDREALLADRTRTGAAWCRAYSDLVDAWLAQLFHEAAGRVEVDGVSLVAVGGYGRAELCPQSDIDVMLLHRGHPDIGALADRVWYPVWDTGLKLGHSVRTTKEALTLADDDLDTATSLLDVRHLAGDCVLSAELAGGATAQWQKRAKRWLAELARRVEERHAQAGEVAFLLEPDLKEGRGGLRDLHALRWAEAAGRGLLERDADTVAEAYSVLLDARVELHRATARAGDVLRLQDQDAVAAALGDGDADALMFRVSSAGRAIAWAGDEAWRRVASSLRAPLRRRARRDRELGPGLVLRDGDVHLTAAAAPEKDPVLPLRAAALAAQHGTVIDRDSLERLAAGCVGLPDPWPLDARTLLAELLLAGQPAIAVIESLDQLGVWLRLIPEWAPVRSRPQRNAYHRFTVDRHLIETATGAARLAGSVARPDLLVIGALLHDIGKGRPGDHTAVGIGLVRTMGERMGFPPDDVDALVAMVRHHLLLPDVATRRDIDDPTTIKRVADAIGSLPHLELLAALTEADSLATGPAAWGSWKAGLVNQLVDRTAYLLGGGTTSELITDEFPTPHLLGLMSSGALVIETEGSELTVVARDRPGLFSRVAGVLSIHGLGVLSAQAYSNEHGTALNRFTVEPLFGAEPRWDRVRRDLDAALAGRLALSARVEDKARAYPKKAAAAGSAPPRVVIDNAASRDSTVVDVQAVDGLGVLFRITRALAELDLDIRSARVQTLGAQVVDAFYVRDRDGLKITDDAHLTEIERAVLFALGASR